MLLLHVNLFQQYGVTLIVKLIFRPFYLQLKKPPLCGLSLTGFINLLGHLFGNKIDILQKQADIHD